MKPKSEREHFTTREVAKRFGVAVGTVSDWIRIGKLTTAFKTPGGRWLIPAKEVYEIERHSST